MIFQAANTGLTGGSTPWGDDYDREIVLVSLRRLKGVHLLDGGRQDKLRPGDLLGALTGDMGLPAEVVGKIDILARHSYVAIRSDRAALALQRLRAGKIKGRSFRARALG